MYLILIVVNFRDHLVDVRQLKSLINTEEHDLDATYKIQIKLTSDNRK